MVSRKILCLGGIVRVYPTISYKCFSSQRNVIPVFRKALQHDNKIAIRDDIGKYTYKDLLNASLKLANEIETKLNGRKQERVALLCPNNATYVIAQWACWISGQIVVPLSTTYPPTVLQYLMSDSQSNLVLSVPEYENKAKQACADGKAQSFVIDPALRESAIFNPENVIKQREEIDCSVPHLGLGDDFYSSCDALIIYTSGSTGLPKGVVLSHANIEAQVLSMVEAWNWQDKDCILHVLPLYHTHGIVNALLTPLYVGARCVMTQFEEAQVWSELVGIKIPLLDRVNVFTAVPTMYAKLIQEFDSKLSKSDRLAEHVKHTCQQKIRLMLCGSAPLSKNIFERWEEITGHRLVQRYGMTETGMTLSVPVEKNFSFGNVGIPMPGVEVRVVSDERDGSKKVVASGNSNGTVLSSPMTNEVHPAFRNLQGKDLKRSITGVLHVSGAGVASKYWNKPQATTSDFKNGWFNTGDIVEYSDGHYTVLGRVSSDIIKTGGFKVFALQIESVMAEYEAVQDVAVVPLDDPVWGEKVGALVVGKEGDQLDLDKLREWCAERLPDYAVPRVMLEPPDGVIPRNHMGKVNRQQLKEFFINQPRPTAQSASA